MGKKSCNGDQSKIKPPTDSEKEQHPRISPVVSAASLCLFAGAWSPGWSCDAGKCLSPHVRAPLLYWGLQSQLLLSKKWNLCIWSLICALHSVQIKSGCRLNVNKWFTSPSPASFFEIRVLIWSLLLMCAWQGGGACTGKGGENSYLK